MTRALLVLPPLPRAAVKVDLVGPEAGLRVCLPRAEPLPNLLLVGATLRVPADAPLTRSAGPEGEARAGGAGCVVRGERGADWIAEARWSEAERAAALSFVELLQAQPGRQAA